jgi:hypothetical protein
MFTSSSAVLAIRFDHNEIGDITSDVGAYGIALARSSRVPAVRCAREVAAPSRPRPSAGKTASLASMFRDLDVVV